METLPDELIVLILNEYLQPSEVVTCRLVSKRFLFLVDNCVNFKELAILSDHPWLPYIIGQEIEFNSNAVERPVRNMIRLQWNRLGPRQVFPEAPFKIQFSDSLKYLELGLQFCLTQFVLNALNELTTLEKLICFEVTLKKDLFEQPVLCLPNLKVLSIGKLFVGPALNSSNEPFKLIVNSKIEQLFYPVKHPRIQLNNPECITFLQVWNFTTDFLSFKNLRHLRCQEISQPVLDSLEEIHLTFDRLDDDRISQTVNRLLNQKAILRRSNVKIYFLGILITRPFEKYQFKIRHRKEGGILDVASMQITHYQNLEDRVRNRISIRYDFLVNSLNDQMAQLQWKRIALNEHGFPVCFFEKFQNIKEIVVSEGSNEIANNEARFAWFLRQCKNLRSLALRTNTSQFIIDQVSKCDSLQDILFWKDADLNYAPLLRLKNLWNLQVCTNVNRKLVALVLDMLQELRYLMIIKVMASKRTRMLKIEKSVGLYCLTHYNRIECNSSIPAEAVKRYLTRDVLVKLLNQIE